MINKLIAKKIYAIRQQLALTQTEFGKLFGASYQTVCAWERNRTIPDINTMMRIIDVAGITCDDFFTDVSQVNEEPDVVKMYVNQKERHYMLKVRTWTPKDRQALEILIDDFKAIE